MALGGKPLSAWRGGSGLPLPCLSVSFWGLRWPDAHRARELQQVGDDRPARGGEVQAGSRAVGQAAGQAPPQPPAPGACLPGWSLQVSADHRGGRQAPPIRWDSPGPWLSAPPALSPQRTPAQPAAGTWNRRDPLLGAAADENAVSRQPPTSEPGVPPRGCLAVPSQGSVRALVRAECRGGSRGPDPERLALSRPHTRTKGV